MTDPAIAAKANAHRHLARLDLEHRAADVRSRLGLVTVFGVPFIMDPAILDRFPVRRRDAWGRFIKAAA